ncbi:hypothetical protein GCM10011579_082110 [Streptomyces albiflavescens]|uniref:Uncharacterized protein n=1 Tax=Streptomyces albiflavescens TaxID=1623582 RepID=A0A917YCT4_9ACTN|nr:hypothetical protein GCM10011579_082110 [Streptomyces albiflavescens]
MTHGHEQLAQARVGMCPLHRPADCGQHQSTAPNNLLPGCVQKARPADALLAEKEQATHHAPTTSSAPKDPLEFPVPADQSAVPRFPALGTDNHARSGLTCCFARHS